MALADDGEDGELVRARLRGCELVAPAGIDLDVIAVWQRAVRSGALSQSRVELALTDLADLPLRRVDPAALVRRCWQLLDTLTTADSAYAALAAALATPLLTADRNLLADKALPCAVERVG